MSSQIALLKLASSLGSYAFARQGVIAQNIANADTPNYKAQDFEKFTKAADQALAGDHGLRRTRPGHIGYGDRYAEFALRERGAFGSQSPNGNTVSLEDQMIRSAEIQQQHDLALGVYTKSIAIMRASLGKR